MEIDIQNLHHAYLIESAPESGERFLLELFERMGFNTTGNPDYFVFESESFLVDDARELNTWAQNIAFGERKVFVIKTRPNLAAQNALLKTFEEPVPNTHFFILLPERDLLLPTLLSRLSIVRVESVTNTESSTEAKKFLSLSPKERLDFVKKFVDKEKPLAEFFDTLLGLLKEKGDNDEIKKVFNLRKFADDQSAMPRLMLEHLALVLK